MVWKIILVVNPAWIISYPSKLTRPWKNAWKTNLFLYSWMIIHEQQNVVFVIISRKMLTKQIFAIPQHRLCPVGAFRTTQRIRFDCDALQFLFVFKTQRWESWFQRDKSGEDAHPKGTKRCNLQHVFWGVERQSNYNDQQSWCFFPCFFDLIPKPIDH